MINNRAWCVVLFVDSVLFFCFCFEIVEESLDESLGLGDNLSRAFALKVERKLLVVVGDEAFGKLDLHQVGFHHVIVGLQLVGEPRDGSNATFKLSKLIVWEIL